MAPLPAPPSYDTPTARRVTAVSALCFAVSFALYVNTAWAEFVWDDRAAVPGNQDLRPTSPWGDLLIHDFWGQDITLASSHKSFRPVTTASYKIQYGWHGPDPFSFHLGNVVLNSIVTALVPVLGAMLTSSVTRGLVAGLLFALHPVHVEAVACIVGRAELLGTLFYVLATLAYVRMLQLQHGDGQTWYWGWLMLALCCGLLTLAIFSKENGITALVAFVMLELVYRVPAAKETPPPASKPEAIMNGHPVGGDVAEPSQNGHVEAPALPSLWSDLGWAAGFTVDGSVRLATVFLWTAIVMSYRLSVHAGAPLYSWTILENQMSLMPPGLSRTLSVLYSHALYGQLIVFPKDLAFDWGFATIKPISGVLDPRNVATVVAYGALLSAMYVALRRRSAPALWGLTAAVAAFIPASNLFLWVGTELAERLLYLPTVGLAIAASACVPLQLPTWLAALAHYVPMPASSRRAITTVDLEAARTSSRPWAVVVVVLLAFGARSRLRTFDWLTEVTVYETGIDTCPDSVKALNNMAYLLLEGDEDDWVAAEPMLRHAVEIWPDHASAFFNLAILGMRWNNQTMALHNLWLSVAAGYTTPGNVFMHLGDKFLAMHDAGLREVPQWAADAGGPAAVEWITANNPEGYDTATPLGIARLCFEEASRKGVTSARQYLGRGSIAREYGFLDGAVTELEIALAKGYEEERMEVVASASSLLGLTYETMGPEKYALAHSMYVQATSLGTNDASVFSNAGNFFAKMGDIDLALATHDKAVALDPTNAVLVNNYGYACELGGRVEQALTAYEQALRLAPGHGLIQNNVVKMRNALQQQQQA